MKWSQRKKRLEASFADSVAGRVEVWSTRYRKPSDELGEAWITIDKERVWSMGTCTYYAEAHRAAQQFSGESFISSDRAQREVYWQARKQAEKSFANQGVCSLEDVDKALFGFLNLSINDPVTSDNPIIRAFAIIDGRFGRRRLLQFNDSDEHPLVRTLYRFRCRAEGIKLNSEPLNPADRP